VEQQSHAVLCVSVRCEVLNMFAEAAFRFIFCGALFYFGRMGVCARASCMLAMFEQFLQWEGEMVIISAMYCNSGC
jgi:hypothetical protein